MKRNSIFFTDRNDAAVKLSEFLPLDRIRSERWHFVAVSKGGLALADFINRRVKVPIEFLLNEPIMAPQNSECEIARVSEIEEIVMHENLVNAFGIQADYIYGEAKRKHEEKILSQMYHYRKGRHFNDVSGKTVLLIDEGAESGLKFMTAIKTVMTMRPKAVYVAVPVLPKDVLESLEPLVDGVFYLHDINDYVETASYYGVLSDIDDKTVKTILGE
jgi:putative phosphoribosyl transferase